MAYAKYTSVNVEQTKMEIERLVVSKHGASQYAVAQSSEPPRAVVQFRLKQRIVRFELPMPTKARDERALAQATKARWRALLLVIKAKLEAVVQGVTTFEEEFLAHIVLPDGRTVGMATLPQIEAAYSTGKLPPLLPEFTAAAERKS